VHFLFSTIEELHGKCIGLKIYLAMFAETTVRRVCFLDQLAFSSHECVHGNFPLVMLDFKQIWNE